MRVIPMVLCLVISAPAWADGEGVEDLVNRALEAYREGNKGEAADLLQKATSLIQKEAEVGLVGFLPPAPEGWERNEVDSESGTWGAGRQVFQWMQASVEYLRGDTVVRLTISSSPQLIEAQRSMVEMMQSEEYRNAMNMDPSHKVNLFQRDEWSGVDQVDKNGGVSRIALTKKLLCHIEITRGDAATLEQFSNLIDWKALAESVR